MSIFHVANLTLRELDPPTHVNLTQTVCGKIQQIKILVYSRKKPNRGVEDIGNIASQFFQNPLKFLIFILYSCNFPDKTKLHPLEIPQKCVRSLGNSKTRNQDPWKFHIIFFLGWLPPFFPLLCFLTSGNSTCYFSDSPGNSISSTPPPVRFFSGIAHCSWCEQLK